MLSTLCQRGKVVLRISMLQPLRSNLTTSAAKAARGGFQERLARQRIAVQRSGPTLRERLFGPTTGKRRCFAYSSLFFGYLMSAQAN